MTDFFIRIYSFLKDHNWFRISLLVFLLGVIGLFASKVSLNEDIAGFMPNDKNSEKINFVYKNIKIADKIIIRFSTKNGDTDAGKQKLIDAVEIFASYIDSTTQNKSLVKEVFYKIDQQPLFLYRFSHLSLLSRCFPSLWKRQQQKAQCLIQF